MYVKQVLLNGAHFAGINIQAHTVDNIAAEALIWSCMWKQAGQWLQCTESML